MLVQKIKHENSPKRIIFEKKQRRNIFCVIKRKYSGVNKSKSTRLQNKETRLKTLVYNLNQITKIQAWDFNKAAKTKDLYIIKIKV